jgi:hypothetical protein
MLEHTGLNQCLQLTCASVRFRRKCLERAMLSGWNADTSRTIDVYLHAEEALANLEAIETGGTLATRATPPTQRPPAQSFSRSRLAPRAWRLNGLTVRTRSYTTWRDAAGFESVGSILPRVLREIDEAAKNNRRGGPR